MRFYKRDPDAALAGMAELTLEECGAYNKIIDLLYSRDGLLPDDDAILRRLLGCHGNQLRAVKASLLRKGKIWIEDGMLKANRVDSVLKEAGNFSETQRKRAGKRWEKSVKSLGNVEITEQNQHPDNAREKMPYTPTPIDKKKESKKKEATPSAQPFALPDFIPGPAWEDFMEMRRKMRKPATERAKALLARSLEELMVKGDDPAEILNQSTLNCWTNVYPLKEKTNGKRPSAHENFALGAYLAATAK